MPTFRRRIATALERLSGNIIVPLYEVHLAPERVHLRRFFDYFEIDCIFDVGANRGQYAQMLRNAVGFTGDIISFEPIPELADTLRTLAAKDRRWHVEQLALDREAGPATFHIMRESELSSLRRPSPDQPAVFRHDNSIARSVTVQRSTVAVELPRYQAQLGFRRPYLKLDTQGNDLAVVEGAGAAIAGFVGLQTELSIKALYEGSAGLGDTLATLQGLGFEPSAFVPNNAGRFPWLIEMDCILFRRDALPADAQA